MSNRKVIETFTITEKQDTPGEDKKQDVKVTLAVVEPSFEDYQEGRKVYNTTFSNVVKAGAIVRSRMDEVLRAQGLWNDDFESKYQEKQSELHALEKTLAKGGISLTEARKTAIDMKILRNEITKLLLPRTQLDVNSAEGQADNEQFNCLVSRCVVYNDRQGDTYFDSQEDYLHKNSSEAAVKAANILAKHLYGVNQDQEKALPENKFLTAFGFADNEFRLVDKKTGQLIDEDGNPVDEDGFRIDKDGNRIDKDGVKINDKNEYVFDDAAPFLDEDGNPVESSDWNYGAFKKEDKVDEEEETVEVSVPAETK